jgi:hypothetical protein
VSDTEGGGGDQLQAFEPMVGFMGIQVAQVQGENSHSEQDETQQDPFEILGVKDYLIDIAFVMCFFSQYILFEFKIKGQEDKDENDHSNGKDLGGPAFFKGA